MAKTHKYTVSEMIQAVKRCRGIVPEIAKVLECNDQTVRNYKKKYKRVDRAFEEARATRREQMLELAEDGLELELLDREWPAIKYTLSTLGRDRYSQRTELTGADGKKLLEISTLSAELLEQLGLDKQRVADELERLLQDLADSENK